MRNDTRKIRGLYRARATLLIALLAAVAAAGQAPAPGKAPQAPGGPGKSLPPEEVSALLAGEGIGLARAAELNHYPGPRHLLDVAGEIGLSEGQRAAIRRLYAEMNDQAREVGRRIVDQEAELANAFARGEITEDRLRTLVAGTADLQRQLRLIHLTAHLKTRKLLSAAQVEKYEKLRGYTED